jgi:predicted O-linked N-acetylglucosamine transferase (SPINDLY family)
MRCAAAVLILLCSTAARAQDAYTLVDDATTAASRGDLIKAMGLFREVVERPQLSSQLSRPHLAQVHFNLGLATQQLGKISDAFGYFERAIAIAPSEPFHTKAAWCANILGRPGVAAAHLQAAVRLAKGAKPDLYLHLADVLNNLKRHAEAIDAYKAGLQRLAKAAGNSRAAIAHDPRMAQLAGKLYHGTGDALLNLGKYDEALTQLQQAQAFIKGHDVELSASLLECYRQLTAWKDLERLVDTTLRQLPTRLVANPEEPPLSPYAALFLDADHRLRFNVTAAFARAIAAQQTPTAAQRKRVSSKQTRGLEARTAVATTPHSDGAADGGEARAVLLSADGAQSNVQLEGSADVHAQDPKQRTATPLLHFGLISRRFHHYPGTHLMLGLFRRFDRSRSRVHCFASGPDSGPSAQANLSSHSGANATAVPLSAERRRLMLECDSFDDVTGMTASETADAVRARDVHVLWDYDGAHDFNNLAALAHAPAAVSASFLGFAGPAGFTRVPAVAPAPSFPAPLAGAALGAPTSEGTPIRDALALPRSRWGTIGHRYSIVDATIAPAELASAMFPEALVYLPHTYQPQDPDQPLSGPRLRPPYAQQRGTHACDAKCSTDEQSGHGVHPDTDGRPLWRTLREEEGLTLQIGLSADAGEHPEALELVVADSEGDWCARGQEDSCESDMTAGSVLAARTSYQRAVNVRQQPPRQDAFVFASFNRLSKLDPAMFTVWMNALRRCGPHCLLWLYVGGSGGPHHWSPAGNGSVGAAQPLASALSAALTPSQRIAMSNLWAQAAACGIHPSRLVFAGRASRPRHLYRLQAADLQLDSLVYGAHTTAADALYTGVPLVTSPGASFASRVGASLLLEQSSAAAKLLRSENSSHEQESARGSAVGSSATLQQYEAAAVRLAAPSSKGCTPSSPLVASLRVLLHDTALANCAARNATCGSTLPASRALTERAMPPQSQSNRVGSGRHDGYLGLFDAHGFAASAIRAAAAMQELNALMSVIALDARAALHLPKLPTQAAHLVLRSR